MEQIFFWDLKTFYQINHSFINPVFDFLLPLFRNKYFWTPFYVFLFSFFITNYKKKGIWIILVMIIMIALADTLSSHVMKPWVHRLRPCKDPDFYMHVRMLVNCSRSYSFPSSHAVNHFALAFFLITMYLRKSKWVLPVLFLWAFMIAYAQVYVGVHYPLDVLVGAGIGTVIGICFGWIPENLLKIEV